MSSSFFLFLSRHVINKTNATRCCCLLATIIARERGSRIDDVKLRTSLSWVRPFKKKKKKSTSVFVAFLLSYSLTLRQLRSYSLTWGSCSYSVTSNNRKRLLKIAQCEPGFRHSLTQLHQHYCGYWNHAFFPHVNIWVALRKYFHIVM